MDLTRKLLETLVPLEKENIILDPFARTVTTSAAAEKLGLDYIGIEIEPNYIEIIKERLADQNTLSPITKNNPIKKSKTANQPALC